MPEAERAPLVTIVMPVRNPHPGYLAEALDSLMDQTVSRWRLLIVVNPPELVEITPMVERWTADPRVRLIANQGVGLAGKLNTAMREAQTEFVAPFHCDDLLTPDAVAVLEDSITRYSNADFFHSARRYIDDTGQAISSVYPPHPNVTLEAFRNPWGGPIKHMLCWRRTFGLAVGGMDERVVWAPDDQDFPWTMAERGAVFCPISQCIYLYRDHRTAPRLTTHVPRSIQIRQLRGIMKKHGATRRERHRRIRLARQGWMRQALYRWSVEARFSRWLRRNPEIWHEPHD